MCEGIQGTSLLQSNVQSGELQEESLVWVDESSREHHTNSLLGSHTSLHHEESDHTGRRTRSAHKAMHEHLMIKTECKGSGKLS